MAHLNTAAAGPQLLSAALRAGSAARCAAPFGPHGVAAAAAAPPLLLPPAPLLAPWAPLALCARWLGGALIRWGLAPEHLGGFSSKGVRGNVDRRSSRGGHKPGTPHRSSSSLRRRLWAAAAAAIPIRVPLPARAAAAAAAAALSAGGGAAAAAGAAFASLGATAAGAAIATAAHALLRRWHAGRRGGWRRGVAPGADGAAAPGASEVSVVTFNIRGISDRWAEREPLLASTLKQLDSDVVCFQEVLTGEFGQDRRLLPDPSYEIYPCKAALDSLSAAPPLGAAFSAAARALLALPPARAALSAAPTALQNWRERRGVAADWARHLRDLSSAPFFGNSIASRLQAAPGGAAPGKLLLGGFRAAQRVRLEVPPPAVPADGEAAQRGGDGGSDGSSSSDFFGESLLSGGAGFGGDFFEGACSSFGGFGGGKAGSFGLLGFGRGGLDGSGAAAAGEEGCSDCNSPEEPLCVWVVNTHLDHASPEAREAQTQAIINWMAPLAAASDCAGVVITGDLNAPPEEPAHAALRKAGYRSAYMVASGAEPAVTWPSGLVAPLMDEGEPHCADYVYILEGPAASIGVLSARIAANAPAPWDATLYPSDHFALHVRLSVARRRGGA